MMWAKDKHNYLVSLDRNNTNFTSQLLAYFQRAEWGSEYSFLKYYQNVVRAFMRDVNIDAKGLLIFHDMGFGKSILGVSIAIEFIKERQPIMLMTKSLQGNMRQSITKYVKMRAAVDAEFYLGRLSGEDLDAWIERNFSFVSMNAGNMLKQINKVTVGSVTEDFDAVLEKKFGEVLKLGNLNGKLLIVDEAHNFFRAITNGSKNAIGLYDMIMSSPDVVVIFLTGTPIASNPFELVPCFNMIGSRVGTSVLPEHYHDFTKFFISNGQIKNKEKFQNRIMGLVSRVSAHSTPGRADTSGKQTGVTEDIKAAFPEELPIRVERINMDSDQYVSYQLARDKEKEENSRGRAQRETPAMTKPKSDATSTYRVKSRQIGNYIAPSSNVITHDSGNMIVTSPKFRAIHQNVLQHPNQPGLVYSQFTGMGGLAAFSKYLDQNGWKKHNPVNLRPIQNTDSLITDQQNLPDDISNTSSMPSIELYLNDIDLELEKTGGLMPWWAVPDDDIPLGSEKIGGCPYVITFSGENERAIDGRDISIKAADGDYLSIINTLNPHQDSLGDVQREDILIIYEDDIPVGYVVFGDKVTYEYYMNLSPEVSRESVSQMAAKVIGELRESKQPMKSQVTGSSDKPLTYAVISGEVPVELRDMIVAAYNSDENMHGGVIDLLLVSSTGAEGLDLKNGRHVHVMEMYWTWGRIMQIIRRLVRNGSHLSLPLSERNVQPYIYLAIPPKSEMNHDGTYPDTTDVELFNEAVQEQICNESFIEALEEVSIECMLNLGPHCRSCNPTGVKLFTTNIDKDMMSPDPCSAFVEQTVQAMEVVVDDVTYHYIKDSTSVYDYRIFMFDDKINSHRHLLESDPRHEKIINAILALIGKSFTGSSNEDDFSLSGFIDL